MGITGGGREETRGVYAPFAKIDSHGTANATNNIKPACYAGEKTVTGVPGEPLLKPELND
ncbi:hypothetical protein DT73_17085 [Mangrovibacter sp. MFB070]|nr:hypothetical protein DT73_17085 [Mangrovibacter sp. MFB070]